MILKGDWILYKTRVKSFYLCQRKEKNKQCMLIHSVDMELSTLNSFFVNSCLYVEPNDILLTS